MKTYIADIIPMIRRYSKKLDNLALLTNHHWVVINELESSKVVYIFRENNVLLISQNGKVEKGTWEYLGNNSLLIDSKKGSYLYRHGFFDNTILALKVDGKEEFAFLVNEGMYGGELNNIESVVNFLEEKYLHMLDGTVHSDEGSIGTPHQLTFGECGLALIEDENWKYGYVNRDGDMIVPYRYDRGYHFSEGLALVYNTKRGVDRYGFIDETGVEVIPLEYEFGESFSEGMGLVKKNGLFGYINKKGEIEIDFQFDDADSFKNGKAKVRKGNQIRYIEVSKT